MSDSDSDSSFFMVIISSSILADVFCMFCSVSLSTEDFKSSSSISLFSSSVRTSYTGVHHVHGVKSVVGFNVVVVVVVVPGVGNMIGGPTHQRLIASKHIQ